MLNLSESQIHDFEAHPVWLEIKRRAEKLQADIEREIENPDSFEHGRAVGQRKLISTFINFPNLLLSQLKLGGKQASVKP